MNKKVLGIIMSILIIINISLPVLATDNLYENKKKINEISSEIKKIDLELSNLNEEINSLNEEISKNENEIYNTKEQIKSNEIKIEILKDSIKKGEETLSIRIREMYKNGITGSINSLSFIIDSNGLADFLSRIHALKSIISIDNKLLKENNEKIDSLNSSIKSLDTKKAQMDKLNVKLKDDLLTVKSKQEKVDESKSKLNEELNNIQQQIYENEINLVESSIQKATSSNSSLSELKNSIFTLEGLLPQLTHSSVISKVNSAINEAKNRIKAIENENNNSNSSNSSNSIPTPPNNQGYLATYTMEATAYYGHGITASGTKPVRNPNGYSTVAVDRSVIPLGTKLYIPNYGYAIAADTGGAIKGMKIDLFMNTREECYTFGRRNITVHIIEYP